MRLATMATRSAWQNVQIDMEHITSGHTPGGSRVSPGSGKDLFPADWDEAKIERAIREAYRNSRKISSIQTTGRVLLQGEGGGRTIQMYLNTTTKTIESAWPK